MFQLFDSLEPVFLAILRASWQASFLIAAILLVQHLFQKYLTARWRYVLWFLVVARLVMPSLPESYFSIFNILPASHQEISSLQSRMWTTDHDAIEELLASQNMSGKPDSTAEDNQAFHSVPISQAPPPVPVKGLALLEIVSVTWGMGTILFLTFVLGQLVTARICLRTLPPVTNPAILKIFDECRSRMRLHKQIRLIESPRMDSPALYGLLHPTLLLPEGMATALGTENLRYVFLHELAHVQRRDIWVNWWTTLLRAIHWFNPLVWYAFRRMRTDQELACDALALTYTQEGESIEYGETIITLLERSVLPQRLPGTAGILEDKHRMRRRIEMIATFKKPGPAWTVLTVVLVAALGLGMLTEGRTIAEEKDTSNQVSQGERVLQFPTEYALGAIWTRPADSQDDFDWEILQRAKGDVTIPADTAVRLSIQPERRSVPISLEGLAPDDFDGIIADAVRLNEEQWTMLSKFTGVRTLSIEATGATDSVLSYFTGFNHLEELDLHANQLTSAALDQITSFPRLRKLNLLQTKVDDTGLAKIAALPNLTDLNLQETAVTDAGMAFLVDMPNLRNLDLAHTAITDAGLVHLGKIMGLTQLRFRECNVTDQGLAQLEGLTALRSLDLDTVKITDACSASIGKLTALERLVVKDNPLTNAFVENMPGLTRIKVFDYAGTKISREVATAFRNGQTNTPPGEAPPKVGVLFSYFTANGPSWIGQPYSFGFAKINYEKLHAKGYDVYAVIEPGTADKGELPAIIEQYGLQDRLIDGSNVEELKKLDVVIAHCQPNVRNEFLDSLIEAVEAGVGFVNRSALGGLNPGYNEKLEHLLGIRQGNYEWKGFIEVICLIIKEHPILGVLGPGDYYVVNTMDGYRGVVDGTPLMAAPVEYDAAFCPLYVRELGQGRIVNIQWHTEPRPTPPYDPVDFFCRCLNWAAKRPVDAKW